MAAGRGAFQRRKVARQQGRRDSGAMAGYGMAKKGAYCWLVGDKPPMGGVPGVPVFQAKPLCYLGEFLAG